MAESGLMVFRSAGVLLGVPSEKVLAVGPWRSVQRLPRGASWLEGLLEDGGEIVPVLKEAFLGPGADPPEVVILLEEEGRRLAVPGSGPVLRAHPGDASLDEGLEQWPAASREEGGGEVRILDPRLLYSTLGLLYNETGSNRGS